MKIDQAMRVAEIVQTLGKKLEALDGFSEKDEMTVVIMREKPDGCIIPWSEIEVRNADARMQIVNALRGDIEADLAKVQDLLGIDVSTANVMKAYKTIREETKTQAARVGS